MWLQITSVPMMGWTEPEKRGSSPSLFLCRWEAVVRTERFLAVTHPLAYGWRSEWLFTRGRKASAANMSGHNPVSSGRMKYLDGPWMANIIDHEDLPFPAGSCRTKPVLIHGQLTRIVQAPEFNSVGGYDPQAHISHINHSSPIDLY